MRRFGVSLLLLLGSSYAQGDEPNNIDLTPVAGNAAQDPEEQLILALNITEPQNVVFSSNSSSSSSSCFTPASERGICGPLKHCPNYLPFVKQLGNQTVNSFFRERICRVLPRTIHICCPLSNPILPFGAGFLQPQPQLSSFIPSRYECGIPPGDRITAAGGQEFRIGSWPWLAAVGQRIDGNQFFVNCGGTLITRKHVLTAAHCFGGEREPDLVRLGEHHLDHDNAGERPEEFRIVRRQSHDYNANTQENDIAILTLDRDVIFNDFIRPVCLPFNLSNEFVGQHLTVLGWGKTAYENSFGPRVPMEAAVPVVDRSRCSLAYQRIRNTPVIDSRNLCAGNGVQSSCTGDSGGPLNYLNLQDGRYYLVGIVSHGVLCARPDFPSVFTRVFSFLDWIQQNLE